jgi:hypothetical protein
MDRERRHEGKSVTAWRILKDHPNYEASEK